MIIESLALRNFCQYQAYEAQFRPGLTAIVGANGAGKSNLLAALRYALTGDAGVEGVKEDNVCQFAEPGSVSSVQLRFVHGGTRGLITRYLRPYRPSVLEEAGLADVTGDREINRRLEAILGVDKQIINDIVIVAQDDIFGFVAKKSAPRAAAFAKLFRTEKAEVCRKALDTHIRALPTAVADGEIEGVREMLDELTREEAEWLRTLGDDTAEQLRMQASALGETLRQWAKKQALAEHASELAGQLNDMTARNAEVAAQLESVGADAAAITEAAERIADEAKRADGAFHSIELRRGLERRKAALEARVRDLRATLDSPPPTAPDPPIDLKRAGLLVAQASHDYRRAQDFVASFDEDAGVTECPTCHTPVDNLQAQLAEARERLPKLKAELTALLSMRDAAATYESQRQVHEAELERARADLDAVEAELRDTDQALESQPVFTPAMATVSKTYHDYQIALARLNGVLESYKVELAKLEATQEQLTAQLLKTRRDISELAVTVEESRDASTRMSAVRVRLSEVESAQTELIRVRAAIAARRDTLSAAEARAERGRFVQRHIERLIPVRDMLHRTAAPRFVSHRNLRRLQARVNEQLAQFDADFRVRADEGVTFVAHFHNGVTQRAERLSGGQKVVLALSFRLAVNFMYADLGFLALDEPTAYLDEHHISGFEPALERLRALASSRGLQCIMVTHERALAPLFDSVINI